MTPAAASLAGLTVAQVRPLLAELSRSSLLTEHLPSRYAGHDLLRAYATELVNTVDSDTDRSAAAHRMLDHYLRTATPPQCLLYPHRDPITLSPPAHGVRPEQVADHAQARAWFTAESPVLLAATLHAIVLGLDGYAWQLAWTLVGSTNGVGCGAIRPLSSTSRWMPHDGAAIVPDRLGFTFTWVGYAIGAATPTRPATFSAGA